MSAVPSFASTINIGSALLGAAETDLQVPTMTSIVFTAGASGSKVEEIVVQASKSGSVINTVAVGVVHIFLHDGTNYRLFDQIVMTAVTASATNAGFRAANRYGNLVLKNGWSIRCSQSVAANANMLVATCFGADF